MAWFIVWILHVPKFVTQPISFTVFYTRISVLYLCVTLRGGLESSDRRLISSIGQTKRKNFFSLAFFPSLNISDVTNGIFSSLDIWKLFRFTDFCLHKKKKSIFSFSFFAFLWVSFGFFKDVFLDFQGDFWRLSDFWIFFNFSLAFLDFSESS